MLEACERTVTIDLRTQAIFHAIFPGTEQLLHAFAFRPASAITRPVIRICAMRMNQIQEKPRGAVLSVIPEKIPMLVKGDDLQYSVKGLLLYNAGRVDSAVDRRRETRDRGEQRAATNIRTSCPVSPFSTR